MHFRSTTDTSRSRTRRIQFIIFIFIKKVFLLQRSFRKLRPIISSISTFNYYLVHFLCDLFSPLIPNNYSCKDTFFFVSQIKNANLSKTFLVSYDVTSLFTNIPLQETIDIAIKKNLKNFFFLLHHRLILFLIVSFTIKSME